MYGMTDTWHVVVRRDDGWYTLCGVNQRSDQWARMENHVCCHAVDFPTIVQNQYPDDNVCEACSMLMLTTNAP
jgi:hypothetical protein